MRDRLIQVAIQRFGELGFDGASTRDIAACADTTMSNITYHFGGKEGLYRAAGEAIVARMQSVITAQPLTPPDENASSEERAALLCSVLRRIGAFMLSDEAEPMARFVAREQQDPNSMMREFFQRDIHGTDLVLERQLEFLRPELSKVERKATMFFLIATAISLRSSRLSLCVFMDVSHVDEELATDLLDQLENHARSVLLPGKP